VFELFPSASKRGVDWVCEVFDEVSEKVDIDGVSVGLAKNRGVNAESDGVVGREEDNEARRMRPPGIEAGVDEPDEVGVSKSEKLLRLGLMKRGVEGS